MTSSRSSQPPSAHPDAKSTELSVDHALALSLADETEAALRWSAAALELGRREPDAVLITSRLLEQMGRRRAAIEGLTLAVSQAIDQGDLALAMAAVGELRTLGADAEGPIDQVASTFCRGAARLRGAEDPQVLPQLGDFQPLSPFLTGPALASKATQILEMALHSSDEVVGREAPAIEPLPLFSVLPMDALRDLLGAFEPLLVGAGESVIREGEESGAAFLVARGELEIARRNSADGGPPVLLTRLGRGAFFGEMALLSHLPGAATVVATRPSILLVARRERIEAVAQRQPLVAEALAAYCRRLSIANLGWASQVVVAVPPRERAALVDRFETRIFEGGDRVVQRGQDADGLHLIVSGEVAVVAYEGAEPVALATLLPGETVGEVELVLCRTAIADAVAVRPTATLYLPREEFTGLVQDHPAILHGLYGIAVRRHNETRQALDAGSAAVAEEMLDYAPVPVEPSHIPSVRTSHLPAAPTRPGSVPPPPALPGRFSATPHASARRRRSTLPPPMMPRRPVEAPSPAPSPTVDIIAAAPPVESATTGTPVTIPGAARAPSVVPTIASVRPVESSSPLWERTRSAGQFVLVAAAAGVVAYAALRGEPTRVASSASAHAADLGAVDGPPPPAVSVPPLGTPAATGSLSAIFASPTAPPARHYVAPAVTAVTAAPKAHAVAVTVEPTPVNAVRAPAPVAAPLPSPGSAATSLQAPRPATSAPTFAPAAKAPAKDALSATEFGGRE
jgi:CRP-like cAMP-binding protein